MVKVKIRLENVCKKFGSIDALRNVNLKIYEGEKFGIFGPSGCGKTTLLRIIAGLEKPDSGNVYLNEVKVASNNYFMPPEKRNVSFVFQDLGLWPHMDVKSHLKFVVDEYKYNTEEKEKVVKNILKLTNLNGYESRKPESLSGGEKQRLSIARALIKRADILLLDEPFSSLDMHTKESMKKLLLDLQKMYNITIVYVTHDIFDLVNLCDRVAIMNSSRVVKVENMTEFLKRVKKIIKL
jgi:iron(III) transport system ATP-binding protein